MYWPASKRTFLPQPAMNARCPGAIPCRNGCFASRDSIVSVSFMPCPPSARSTGRGPLAGADGPHLFCNVDPHRAPGDASPAPDTTRGAELVNPGRYLVRHPLAVSGLVRAANAAPMDVG